ncbi:hypothetical protein Tco_0313681 [Tanacetum coccineum]
MIHGTDLHCFDVHNYCYFAHLPLRYADDVIFYMSVSRMPYEKFAEFLEEKCGNYFQGLYYQVPNIDLERGLVRVSNDMNLSYMFDVEETFGRLEIYLDHLDMDLLEYLSHAITIDMDACVSKTIGPYKKRYCNDFSMDEMVDWAEREVKKHDKGKDATVGVEAKTSTSDKGKEKVSQDVTKGVEARISTVDHDYDSEFDSNDDSDYHSDKSVDYLSPGEEELIKLKNRMKANKEAKAKAKANLVLEMNEPNDENSMHADNVRGETFEEHDIYINELLTRLKSTDQDGITKDPFIYVGEKYVPVNQFKECLTYYALANGFSLWYKRSSGMRVVAKCGQRPPKLSVPKKGKQRKQSRYPSASRDELPTCPWRFGEHYAMLRSYGKAILDSNIGSTVKLGVTVNPDDKTYFDSFYVCFAELADGWKAGCRRIITLDGCFLKSPNQGEILTAIRRDGNNHIYPLA